MNNETKVHLDHLIKRQSLRYKNPQKNEFQDYVAPQKSDSNIRFSDIQEEDRWFSRLVKPDFQRATCAWTPEGCVNFLTSVIRRRIIPSIILWRNSSTGFVYVLDGAHRLSVLRAWMIDDWGDKDAAFYAKSENYTEILKAAAEARKHVNDKVGEFKQYSEAAKELRKINTAGEAPRQVMSPERFDMAQFYLDIFESSKTLHAQWEGGDYDAAEESFLAINRQGAPLDDLESNLIEYRKGSFSRLTMSIASAGAPGHYWPEPTASENISESIIEISKSFDGRCNTIHDILFVPPFDSKILDINVPFMVAPGHFRKHQHLVEALPLLSEGITTSRDSLISLLSKDHKANPEDVIINADNTLKLLENKISHLGNINNTPLSLSIAPLIFWYNKQGTYVRGLFYGFCHWLLSGTTEEIKARKIALSAVRGELEEILIAYKSEYSDIQHRGGAGFKSISKIAETIQNIVKILLEGKDPHSARNEVENYLGAKKPSTGKTNSGRSFTTKSKAEINIREILASSIKCQICGGLVDLKQAVQYDHIHHYAKSLNSSPSNGRPTHPFCNLHREEITKIRNKTHTITLPPLKIDNLKGQPTTQLNLFDSFPGI
ncbi:HNH endonuclease signature motif containing protein [Pseudomonas sp. 2(2015)]|uniref:HNH endonuclease signature motif containing protein n=1 Tax=Pseudomonas sp. 2(2015) TaxID=1619950 RepID=UPI0009E4853B|nr:HNH endonuclease signature motif containing protein [Pseudomonas sp. 2(2015)]